MPKQSHTLPLFHHRNGRLAAVLILLCTLFTAHAQQVAVKSNLLMFAGMAPNVGCEFVVGERSTIDLSVFGSKNVYGKQVETLGLQPEYRYWFNGRPMTREFVGIAALGVSYNIRWGERVFEGDAAGAGITFGYAFNLGKRWNIEAYGGFGAVYFKHRQYYSFDHYDETDESNTIKANAKGYKLLPIKLGVSISYILK
ncbi:DUF3575 domain-containing protein [uncultured Mediterranea sp.]|uniref:DUF3575 domain-containing protein n=1 Tax=uncultured Mediterranea sp. TaxID=1926662 RepID=UPI00258E8DE1|nr:DUF3575 domain-containing protein [uncultured Mediterranea sp.]